LLFVAVVGLLLINTGVLISAQPINIKGLYLPCNLHQAVLLVSGFICAHRQLCNVILESKHFDVVYSHSSLNVETPDLLTGSKNHDFFY